MRALFTGDAHVQVQETWGIYQRMIAAYSDPDRAKGRELMFKLMKSVSTGVPAAPREVITPGQTLKQRADNGLA